MTRLEDTVRAPRTYRGEVGEEDGPKAVPDLNGLVASTIATPSYEDEPGGASKGGTDSDTTNKNTNGASNNTNPSGNTGPTAGASSSSSNKNHPALSQEETIELTRKAVENGIQETKRSLAGNEAVSDMVRPKLTIDLGHSHIFRIPELVVDIIKDEVERYGLFAAGRRQRAVTGSVAVLDLMASLIPSPQAVSFQQSTFPSSVSIRRMRSSSLSKYSSEQFS
jgi:hypothetical protein